MPIERYSFFRNDVANINSKIYRAVQNGEIPYKTYVTTSGDRLDHIAYKEYDDAHYWWIIAAASGIGWWMQMTEGTVLNIPTNISDIEDIRERG